MHIHYIAIILCGALLPPLVPASAGITAAPNLDSRHRIAASYDDSSRASQGFQSAAPMRLSQTGATAPDTQTMQNYLESVGREAAHTDAASARPPAGVAESPPPAAPPAPAARAEAGRFDAIRSIVSEALAVPRTEKTEIMPGKEVSSPVAKQRRQRLQEVVISAPPPKDSPGDNYISVLKDEVSTTVVVQPGGGSGRMTVTSSTEQELGEISIYTVRYGDSLWTIAERVYGNGYLWASIFDANRDRITDADILLVGQRLKIPKL